MSHIIHEYAKHCNAKIGVPRLSSHFFPAPLEEYAIIHAPKHSQAKSYGFWSEALHIFKKDFPDIKLVQLGLSEESIPECDYHFFGISYTQISYLLEHCSLFIGCDDFVSHMASVYDKPLIVLFSNLLPQHSHPYWNRKSRMTCLFPKHETVKPSYSSTDQANLINTIPPESICNAFRDIVGMQECSFKTLFVGPKYSSQLIEVVPNFYGYSPQLNGKILNLRMDYHFDELNLQKWLDQYSCSIIVDRSVEIDILQKYRSHLVKINFYFPDEINSVKNDWFLSYLNTVQSLGVPIKIHFHNPNLTQEDTNWIKKTFFDFDFDIFLKKPPEIEPEILDSSNSFLSKKLLLADGETFYSKSHWKKLDKTKSVHNTDDFKQELDYFLIYHE